MRQVDSDPQAESPRCLPLHQQQRVEHALADASVIGQPAEDERRASLGAFDFDEPWRFEPLSRRRLASQMHVAAQRGGSVGPGETTTKIGVPRIVDQLANRVQLDIDDNDASAEGHLHSLYESSQPISGSIEQFAAAGDFTP